MLSADQIANIISIEYTPALNHLWLTLIADLQDNGYNFPNVRVGIAATIAVESMFNPAAVAPGADPFRGRGLIQLTSEGNYGLYGVETGLDLRSDPDLALNPNTGCKIAVLYFKRHNLYVPCNQGNWQKVRFAVNPMLNGLDRFLGFVWQMLEAEHGS